MNRAVIKAGKILKSLREKSNLTQENLAYYLGVDQSLISKFETGERSIGTEQIQDLADLLGVDVSVFTGGTDIAEPLHFALRANGISKDDLQAISKINKIALNSNFMTRMLRINKIDEQ